MASVSPECMYLILSGGREESSHRTDFMILRVSRNYVGWLAYGLGTVLA